MSEPQLVGDLLPEMLARVAYGRWDSERRVPSESFFKLRLRRRNRAARLTARRRERLTRRGEKPEETAERKPSH